MTVASLGVQPEVSVVMLSLDKPRSGDRCRAMRSGGWTEKVNLEIEKCKVSAVEAMTGHELAAHSKAILTPDGAAVGHAAWASLPW
ncbi:hypothetical protein [Rhodopirellula sp. P2]|uniref:hypothetical protein n=1 Tax=Rhodopirellula sp. P2 TaxID=2127060 RepID=UPI002368837E|nr:hypothetical protein [Rhodopirellula sp. P2]WDQ15129.1 hypothetical protein PSR62_15950 [Rhodopirellula sp. P2]